jgi:hypothetical protein
VQIQLHGRVGRRDLTWLTSEEGSPCNP